MPTKPYKVKRIGEWLWSKTRKKYPHSKSGGPSSWDVNKQAGMDGSEVLWKDILNCLWGNLRHLPLPECHHSTRVMLFISTIFSIGHWSSTNSYLTIFGMLMKWGSQLFNFQNIKQEEVNTKLDPSQLLKEEQWLPYVVLWMLMCHQYLRSMFFLVKI